jgi:hypothetical protein
MKPPKENSKIFTEYNKMNIPKNVIVLMACKNVSITITKRADTEIKDICMNFNKTISKLKIESNAKNIPENPTEISKYILEFYKSIFDILKGIDPDNRFCMYTDICPDLQLVQKRPNQFLSGCIRIGDISKCEIKSACVPRQNLSDIIEKISRTRCGNNNFHVVFVFACAIPRKECRIEGERPKKFSHGDNLYSESGYTKFITKVINHFFKDPETNQKLISSYLKNMPILIKMSSAEEEKDNVCIL